MKKAFCKMCVTICGRFCSDESVVAGYDNRIRTKYTAKWGVQIAGMIFQTRSRQSGLILSTLQHNLIIYIDRNEKERMLQGAYISSGFSFFYTYDAVIYDTVYVNKYFRCKNWRAQIIPCSPISFS